MRDEADSVVPKVIWGMIVAVVLFALSAYVKKEVADAGKSYMSAVVWQTWAQDQSVWRGAVNAKLEQGADQRNKDREEFLRRLNDFDKKLDQVILLFRLHMNTNSPVTIGTNW